MRYADIERALWGTGLICRGGFHPGPDDAVPEPSGIVNSVVIVGNAGGAMWAAFSRSLEYEAAAPGDHPLNAWTERTLGDIAARLGCDVVFPFGGPPYHPFQQWAQRADSVFTSPIGPLIHGVYGLWHAYRGAFLIGESIALPRPAFAERPCDTCKDRPCLASCPVDAFGGHGYDVPRCVDHIGGVGGSECIDYGCAARRACPVGQVYTYQPDQAAFHQRHFLRTNRTSDDREPGF